jgi:hypothetical protein
LTWQVMVKVPGLPERKVPEPLTVPPEALQVRESGSLSGSEAEQVQAEPWLTSTFGVQATLALGGELALTVTTTLFSPAPAVTLATSPVKVPVGQVIWTV